MPNVSSPSVNKSVLIDRVNENVPSPVLGLLVIVTGAVPLVALPTKSAAVAVPDSFCQLMSPVPSVPASQPVTVPLNVNVLEVVSLPSTGVTLSVKLIFGAAGGATPAPVQYTL